MPTNLKKRVRARMAKTGESYEQALRHVRLRRAEPANAPANVMTEPATSVLYFGAVLEGNAKRQVSAVIWSCLRSQKYVEGTEVHVDVEKRDSSYAIHARAREPGGPTLRLADLELPLRGVESSAFHSFADNNALTPSDNPAVVGIDFPRGGITRR